VAEDFTLHDFRRQLDQIQKIGMNDLVDHLPGLCDKESAREDPERALNRIRQMIDAMTDEEKSNPDIIDSNRRSRIASDSGTGPGGVDQFLMQFHQVQAVMRQMAGLSLWQLLRMITGLGNLPPPKKN
jgi:signal recognition particle subunit SRP54